MPTPSDVNSDAAPPIPADLAMGAVPFTTDDLDLVLASTEGRPEGVASLYAEADDLRDEVAGPVRRVGGFQVHDDESAEFAMGRLAEAQDHLVQVRSQAAAWRARVDEWEQEATRATARRATYLEVLLEGYMAEVRAASHGKTKSLTVPSGAITSRGATAPKVQIEDEAKVQAWAEDALSSAEYEEVVKTTTKVYVGPLRKRVKIVGSGDDRKIVDGNGEQVPGLYIEDPQITFGVTPR